MEENKRKVIDRTVKEFDAVPLSNGYQIIPRIKEFCSAARAYQVLSLNLYNRDEFVKSIAVPLDKISELAKALRSISRQLQIVEKTCGNCAFFHTPSCNYAGSPILRTDKIARNCTYFVPKSQSAKIKETPKGLNPCKEQIREWLRDRRKEGYSEIGNGKYII